MPEKPETDTMKAAREAEERRVKIVAHAKDTYGSGNLEFDDNAEVSESDDPQENGAYVQCWKWVPFTRTEFDKEKAD
jgi:hypothetical protein